MNCGTLESRLRKEFINSQQKMSVMDNKDMINIAGFN